MGAAFIPSPFTEERKLRQSGTETELKLCQTPQPGLRVLANTQVWAAIYSSAGAEAEAARLPHIPLSRGQFKNFAEMGSEVGRQ
ncbi:hypothetical protein AOLI_G00093420 [Acnodon oligacanthus]